MKIVHLSSSVSSCAVGCFGAACTFCHASSFVSCTLVLVVLTVRVPVGEYFVRDSGVAERVKADDLAKCEVAALKNHATSRVCSSYHGGVVDLPLLRVVCCCVNVLVFCFFVLKNLAWLGVYCMHARCKGCGGACCVLLCRPSICVRDKNTQGTSSLETVNAAINSLLSAIVGGRQFSIFPAGGPRRLPPATHAR